MSHGKIRNLTGSFYIFKYTINEIAHNKLLLRKKQYSYEKSTF